jgi:group I intron endonuclease
MPKLFGYVYLVTNTVNQKSYIGCTVDMSHRWSAHKSLARNGSPHALHRAIRKYGENAFTVECICSVLDNQDNLFAIEISCVATYASFGSAGYNMTPGGDCGYPDAFEGIHSSHKWVTSVTEANRRKARDPKWLSGKEARDEKLRKIFGSPEFRRKASLRGKEKFSDPVHREAWAERNRNLSSTPEWKESHTRAMRERAQDPVWRKVNAEAMRKLARDPIWLQKVSENGKKSGEISTAKALARDEKVSPEERERRVRNREYHREWVRKRRDNANI